MRKRITGIPLEGLVSTDKNMYELTNAAIHRARQITLSQTDEPEKPEDKAVSQAIKELVIGDVQYSIRQE
ncbi:MAG: hypothetical protein B6D68_02790 [spirochete symbiont of Stewartia floridana]|nr:MAG: hypothetical protein B6D68_02790 [spirochete symbiont of Stewartia floridana]